MEDSAPTQPAASTNAAQQQVPKNGGSSMAMMLGAIVVIVIIAIAGLYFLTRHSTSSPKSSSIPTTIGSITSPSSISSKGTTSSTTISPPYSPQGKVLLEKDLNKSSSFDSNDFEAMYTVNITEGFLPININLTLYKSGNKTETVQQAEYLGTPEASTLYTEYGFNISCTQSSEAPSSCWFNKSNGEAQIANPLRTFTGAFINTTNFSAESAGTNTFAGRPCDNFLFKGNGADNATTYFFDGNMCIDSQYGYVAELNATETVYSYSTVTQNVSSSAGVLHAVITSFSENGVNQSVFTVPGQFALYKNLNGTCSISTNSMQFEFLALQPMSNPKLSIISQTSAYDNATKSFNVANVPVANITLVGDYSPYNTYNEALSTRNVSFSFQGSICINNSCEQASCIT